MAIKPNIVRKMVRDWKNGKFTSLGKLGIHYGCSTSTASRIIGKEEKGANQEIIKMGVDYELAKHATRSPEEIKSIEFEVDQIVDLDNLKKDAEKYAIAITLRNMKNIGKKVVADKKDVIMKGGKNTPDYIGQMSLDFADHERVQNTVDKAMITIGAAARHSNQQIAFQVNSTDATEENLSLSFE